MSEVTLFASLVGPLLGIYYPLPFDNERSARIALNTSRLAKLWGGVYTRAQVNESIAKRGGLMLPDSFARKLDYDSHAVISCFDYW